MDLVGKAVSMFAHMAQSMMRKHFGSLHIPKPLYLSASIAIASYIIILLLLKRHHHPENSVA
jgi:hypothetical protein